RAITGVRRFTDQPRGQIQPFTDALAQLLGGRVGEGHRQDLAHAQPLFHHQPGEQRGQGEGLAGAGAGLDQAQAIERQLQIRVLVHLSGIHAAPPFAASCSPSKSGSTRPSFNAVNINRLLWINLCAVVSAGNGATPRSGSCSVSPSRSPLLRSLPFNLSRPAYSRRSSSLL